MQKNRTLPILAVLSILNVAACGSGGGGGSGGPGDSSGGGYCVESWPKAVAFYQAHPLEEHREVTTTSSEVKRETELIERGFKDGFLLQTETRTVEGANPEVQKNVMSRESFIAICQEFFDETGERREKDDKWVIVEQKEGVEVTVPAGTFTTRYTKKDDGHAVVERWEMVIDESGADVDVKRIYKAQGPYESVAELVRFE